MNKKIVMLILVLFSSIVSFGQVKFGLRGGVNTLQVDKNSQISTVSQLASQISNLAIEHTKTGIAAGAFLQVKVWKILIQSELLFSETRLDYSVTFIDPNTVQNILNEIKSEKSQFIDIPLLVGMRFGPVRLHIGPSAHLYINSTSELLEYENYEEKFKNASYSWVADIGLDYKKFLFDVRYEGNFSAIGSQFVMDGQPYSLDSTPGRWLFTAGIYF